LALGKIEWPGSRFGHLTPGKSSGRLGGPHYWSGRVGEKPHPARNGTTIPRLPSP